MADLVTNVPVDPSRLAFLAPCIDHYGVGDPAAEWPNNMISRRAVAYTSGRLARQGASIRHAIDPEELTRCRALASDVARVMDRVAVGMGSNAGDGFHGYYAVANADEPPATHIDERLVRWALGDTQFPAATFAVEPLDASGAWWTEVEEDAEGDEAILAPWHAMLAWFAARPELVDRRFVSIGDRQALWKVESDPKRMPKGSDLTPCTLPRLPLGLTRGGSLVGLFGWSVQT